MRRQVLIHVTSLISPFLVPSSRPEATVSHQTRVGVAREEDHVRRWPCECPCSITWVPSENTDPDPFAFLCPVETKVEGSSAKKEKNCLSTAKKQQRQLEKEVDFT